MLPPGPRPGACLSPLLMCLSARLDAFQNCQAQVQAWCPDGSAECLQITQHKHARGRRPVRRVGNRHTGTTLSAASAAPLLRACHTAASAGCRHCRQARRPNHHTACTHWHTHPTTLCSQAVPDAQSPDGPCALQAPQASLRLARSLILSPRTLPIPGSYMFTGARAQHAARHAHKSEGVGQITNSLQANVLEKLGRPPVGVRAQPSHSLESAAQFLLLRRRICPGCKTSARGTCTRPPAGSHTSQEQPWYMQHSSASEAQHW